MKAGAREIFTVHGTIGVFDGYKRFVPNSPRYQTDEFRKIPVGKKVSMTISEFDAIRSDAQLAYHFVLMGYLAEYTGFTKEEMHDAVMRLKFGEKPVSLGGNTVMVRRSLAKHAKARKYEVVDLITYDLELCAAHDIVVPTAAELGYLPN